jgi:hypothetical protein
MSIVSYGSLSAYPATPHVHRILRIPLGVSCDAPCPSYPPDPSRRILSRPMSIVSYGSLSSHVAPFRAYRARILSDVPQDTAMCCARLKMAQDTSTETHASSTHPATRAPRHRRVLRAPQDGTRRRNFKMRTKRGRPQCAHGTARSGGVFSVSQHPNEKETDYKF